ncbi:FkbM family methyltransferase [Dyadobacter flavalbus]|uniref:FkbM family methyltransferase n=1 Tax=Dyadobacter flavalbus TaxID=2579942 RepID=A0A5M8QVR5_9BACT|nr:FkbM family methyltransferase [Dyadobacter flavalbus]KAA6439421.1 FkbM family methyltransferase [Dyadobacter flavalbus]
MGLRSIVEEKIRQSRLTPLQKEMERILKLPRFTVDLAHVFEKPFKFHDTECFVNTYNEIFINEIYHFKPVPEKDVILDCGANMGLSVLYFARTYPDHLIYAFEPETEIFAILKENVETFNLTNVRLFEKAIWNKEETLEFYTDKGMGGRVVMSYENQEPTRIDTLRLSNYLTDKVDFLKIDIEGAEDTVLRDCKDKLSQVGSFFFEYHNDVNKPQTLHELLNMIKDIGFHYYIKESGVRRSPFIDTNLICESFDMAINIFCYK